MVNESWIIAELLCGQMPQSGAPWVGKLGNLSIREILVVTLAYLRPSIRPSVRTYVRTNAGGGGGEFQGNPKATQGNPLPSFLPYLLTYLLACLLAYLLTYLLTFSAIRARILPHFSGKRNYLVLKLSTGLIY